MLLFGISERSFLTKLSDIKRIVFESTFKYNGKTFIPIPIPHLKQIAGRAGRYRIAPQAKPTSDSLQSKGDKTGGEELSNSVSISPKAPPTTVGLVTTLEKLDFPRIQRAMDTEPEPVLAAGIFPPSSVLVKFAAYFAPGMPFSYVLQRLHEISSLHPRYFLCDLKDKLHIADIIEPVKELTIEDRIVFCAAPVSDRADGFNAIVVSFAQCVANSRTVSSNLLDIPNLPLEVLEQEPSLERMYLVKLELLHKALILYIWLSYRFVGVFTTQSMAVYLKEMVEEKIDTVLAQSSTTGRKGKLKSLRQLAMLEELGQAIGSSEELDVQQKSKSEPSKDFRFDLDFGRNDVGEAAESLVEEEEELPETEEHDAQVPDPESTFDWQQTPPQAMEQVNAATELVVSNTN